MCKLMNFSSKSFTKMHRKGSKKKKKTSLIVMFASWSVCMYDHLYAAKGEFRSLIKTVMGSGLSLICDVLRM